MRIVDTPADERGTPALTLARIEERLRAHAPLPLPVPDGVTRAAVLVLLRDGPEGPEILLTQRSHDVRDHKGQVSFPGGAAEDSDADPTATAVREAAEEVGLDPAAVRMVGRLDDYVTITNYHVTPVVAFGAFDGLSARTDEITDVFPFPLAFMADPSHVERAPGAGMGRKEDILFVQFGDPFVWGATARILNNLLEIVT
ncbi:MAG: CoA pyrophosphatase [Deltaproteobacteria bacterium]|nr:CoA pyrophosphatase [Deltaproteobacteria bacterium]